MQYIPVTGLSPVSTVKNIIINHFGAALISIAEPTTSRGWSIHQVYRQMDKIFKNFNEITDPNLKTLLLDSGGFQILMGYISKNRLHEYIDTYHFLLKKFHNHFESEDIETLIFSLDVLNKKLSKTEIFKYNKYSIESSLKIFEQYPKLKNRQLFIVQSRFPETLEIWKTIIKDNNIFDIYSRYSFGGLVGLKKETNAKFLHFSFMTMWLLTYARSQGKREVIKHIHMLGQSSRLAIITAVIMEEILNIKITMDSSEVLRFSPIEAKLPLVYRNKDGEFDMARDQDHLEVMLENNVDLKPDGYNIEEALSTLRSTGKVSNPDFVEVVCQGIESTLTFANKFKADNLESIENRDILNWTVEDFKQNHPIFKQGRLAQELVNSLEFIKKGLPYLENGNFEEYHKEVIEIISGYYK